MDSLHDHDLKITVTKLGQTGTQIGSECDHQLVFLKKPNVMTTPMDNNKNDMQCLRTKYGELPTLPHKLVRNSASTAFPSIVPLICRKEKHLLTAAGIFGVPRIVSQSWPFLPPRFPKFSWGTHLGVASQVNVCWPSCIWRTRKGLSWCPIFAMQG